MPTAVCAHAQEANDPSDTPQEIASQDESLNLLRHSRYVELDAKMNAIQRSYELAQITDERLLHEFRAFYDTDPALAGRYDAWIEKMPRSFSALLARGIYLRYLGKEARGSAYIDDTPRQQIEAMSAYLAKAMRDYNASLTLTKKPLLTYHSIIAVTMLEPMMGDRGSRKKDAERIRPRRPAEFRRSLQVLRFAADALGRQPRADAGLRKAGTRCRTLRRPAQILREHASSGATLGADGRTLLQVEMEAGHVGRW